MEVTDANNDRGWMKISFFPSRHEIRPPVFKKGGSNDPNKNNYVFRGLGTASRFNSSHGIFTVIIDCSHTNQMSPFMHEHIPGPSVTGGGTATRRFGENVAASSAAMALGFVAWRFQLAA